MSKQRRFNADEIELLWKTINLVERMAAASDDSGRRPSRRSSQEARAANQARRQAGSVELVRLVDADAARQAWSDRLEDLADETQQRVEAAAEEVLGSRESFAELPPEEQDRRDHEFKCRAVVIEYEFDTAMADLQVDFERRGDFSPQRLQAEARHTATVQALSEAERWRLLDELWSDVSRLLDAKATPIEATAFRRWLIDMAVAVAEASKSGGFLGIGGERVTDAEENTLSRIAATIGLADWAYGR